MVTNPLELLDTINTNKWQKKVTMTTDERQKRMEQLAYYKAHFDVIAVVLAIVFLGYQISKVSHK